MACVSAKVLNSTMPNFVKHIFGVLFGPHEGSELEDTVLNHHVAKTSNSIMGKDFSPMGTTSFFANKKHYYKS